MAPERRLINQLTGPRVSYHALFKPRLFDNLHRIQSVPPPTMIPSEACGLCFVGGHLSPRRSTPTTAIDVSSLCSNHSVQFTHTHIAARCRVW